MARASSLPSRVPHSSDCSDSGRAESGFTKSLAAITYTSLAAIRDAFVAEFILKFQLPTTLPLTPAILTFAGTASGRQLQQWDEYPHLWALVRMLNTKLKSGAGRIRFFIIDNDKSDCLTKVKQQNGDEKVIFANGFTPNVVEWTNLYDRTSNNTPW